MPDTDITDLPHAANSTCFAVSITDRIAHIRLNRPDALNTMIPAFWTELPAIVSEIDRAARARVIVISSAGRHFSAGMDLSVFGAGGVSQKGSDPWIAAEAFRHKVAALQNTNSCLERARIPVLCAIQGGVIGGAVDLVTACDCRWAARDAFFQIQEINIGMVADVGTFPRIQRLIPDGIVRDLAFTGRRMGADEALRLGLVSGVFDTAEATLEAVMQVARDIAAKAPLAVTGTKHILNYGRDHSTQDTLDQIGLWNAAMLAPPHMAEAMIAMREKREAAFADLAAIPDAPL